MKKSNWTTLLLNLSLLGSGAMILFFLFVFPTRVFSSLIHLDLAPFQKFQGLAVFCFGFLTMILLALKQWWKAYNESSRAAIPVPAFGAQFAGGTASQRRWWGIANTVLSIGILASAISSIDTPMDIDENIHALMMTRGLYGDELDPIKSDSRVFFTQNHVIAQAASIAAMEALGFEKIPYRAPAILFTALLLLVVPLAFRSLFPTPGYSLALGFLAANAFTLWYLHSARGYVSLLWVTALSYFLVMKTLENRTGRLYFVAYTATIFLSPFVHFFSMIFHLLLTIALVFWVAINRASISREKSRTIFKLILAQAAALPLYLFVLARNLMFMSSIGDFEKTGEVSLWKNVTKAFGIAFDWQARAYLLFALLLVVFAVFHRPGLFKRFTTVFVATTLFFFTFVLTLLDAKVFESRFVLAFTLPLAVWLVDASFYLARGRAQRLGAVGVLGVLLVVFPALGHRAIYRTLTFNLQDFDDLMKVTRQLTSPIEKSCYLISGKRDLSIFARDFYLRKAKQVAYSAEGDVSCKVFYHLRIEPSPEGTQVNWIPAPRAIELWNNHRGMALYLQNQNSFVAARD